MKIVYLSNSTIPSRSANSVHVMKMCQAFAEQGCDVDLVVKGDASGKIEARAGGEEIFKNYGVVPIFTIHRVRWRYRTPGKYMIYAWSSARLALRLKPDLVYGRYLFGVWAAERLGGRVAYESHSDEFNRARVHHQMAERLVKSDRCKAIVVISQELRSAWIEEFPEAKSKLIVAPDGADLKELPGMNVNDLPPDGQPEPATSVGPAANNRPFTIGYVGHLYRGKGMEMIARLALRCSDLNFLVVGGSEEDLATWKKRLKGAENIEFTGYVPHQETDRYLARMDVVLAPYTRTVDTHAKGIDISRWMSPLKLFEYMAAQKPILASSLPPIREILIDEEEALLRDPDRPDQWFNALQRLLEDAGLRNRLALNARQKLETNYTWSIRARTLIDALK